MRAIYVRTSTRDQDGRAQIAACARVAEARGWEKWETFLDLHESSRKAKRPKLEVLRKAVAAGKVRELVCYKLDRLARSAIELDQLIREFELAGCKLVFVADSIDTSTPAGILFFRIVSAIAEFERDTIRTRVLSGLDAAREHGTRSGKPIGRPRVEVDAETVRQMRESGLSWFKISEALEISIGTARRALEACQNPT